MYRYARTAAQMAARLREAGFGEVHITRRPLSPGHSGELCNGVFIDVQIADLPAAARRPDGSYDWARWRAEIGVTGSMAAGMIPIRSGRLHVRATPLREEAE